MDDALVTALIISVIGMTLLFLSLILFFAIKLLTGWPDISAMLR